MNGSYSLRLTDDQVDDVVGRYRAGDSIRVVALHFACSDSVIRNALRLRSVTMRIGSHRVSDTTGRGYRYS
jgi:uncharacterized protein (DUF433 family)